MAKSSSNSTPNSGEYRSESAGNFSKIPVDMIFDILSRLPIKTIVQLRCVSKRFSSLIRDPSFSDLHTSRYIKTHTDTTFHLLITTYNNSTTDRHFLSASPHGGATAHLLTLPDSPCISPRLQHVNGLFLIRRNNDFFSSTHFVYFFNPTIREITRLPLNVLDTNSASWFPDTHLIYNLGFDGIQHKVLQIRHVNPRSYQAKVDFSIFSTRNFSWKKIDGAFPFDSVTGQFWLDSFKNYICVNGVIHWLVIAKKTIVAFNLKEEKFCTLSIPINVDSIGDASCYLIQASGMLVLACHHNQELDMWILEDYENRLWVKETINYPNFRAETGIRNLVQIRNPLDSIYTGEIILKPFMTNVSTLMVPLYDMSKKSCRCVKISLYPQWLSSTDVEIENVKGFEENILCFSRNACL